MFGEAKLCMAHGTPPQKPFVNWGVVVFSWGFPLAITVVSIGSCVVKLHPQMLCL